MGEYTDFHHKIHHDEEEEVEEEEEGVEEEEALSLCDLPLDNQKESSSASPSPSPRISNQQRRSSSSSEPSEFFEFLSDFTTEMCSAEDIIFCGKLIPLNEHSPPTQNPKQDRQQISFRRRSESLPGWQTSSSVTRSNSTTKSKLSSRSLDYSMLQRLSNSTNSTSSASESSSGIERNSSLKSVGKGENLAKKMVKPRWYVLIFGRVKPPAEMELSDIKSRQVGRNPWTMFPPADASTKKPPVNRSPDRGTSRLLRVLSCRDYTNVAVATAPHAPQSAKNQN